MSFRIREAVPDDADRLSDLVRCSFLTLGAEGWSEAARAHLLQHTSAEVLRDALQAPAVALVCEAGDDAGELWGGLLMRRPDELQILFVDPTQVRRGMGRALWAVARERLSLHHPDVRTVGLNATTHAVAAYRRLGFAPISSAFERGGAVAVRMACWLPGAALQATPGRAEEVVRRYWALMQGNDFAAVGAVLAPDFHLEWPQSGERIRGAAAYARMNAEYPAHGRWRFHLRQLVAQGDTVHTEVDVTDGVMRGRALSRFHLRGGLIRRIVEYWPDPFPAPASRAHLVEAVGDDRNLQLVWPAAEHLAGYTAALERGWSADTVRGPAAAAEELARIHRDPAAFLASLVDRAAAGGPVTLPDGRQVPRLPGFRRWLWDGEFCGSINFRWQPGTEALPPHVLGHIGYSVVPWKQGAGYATRALALLLDDVRAEGLRHVILTTDIDNLASQRVIEANGGRRLAAFTLPDSFGGGQAWRYRIDLDRRPGA